jgi:DNA-binding MarR family transcriptional regulator
MGQSSSEIVSLWNDSTVGEYGEEDGMSTRDELSARIEAGLQQLTPHLILNNERIAGSMGLLAVDLQTLHVMMLAGSPVIASDVSALAKRPRATTTRVLDRLEKAGYVSRAADPADRRKTRIVLHHDKLAEIAAQYEGTRGQMRAIAQRFDPDELDAVARYLETMVSAAESVQGRTTEG